MNPRRWKMSLGTFLLLVTVLILAFSHIITSRQLAATNKELLGYRYQYGHLVVDDPSRPHVLRYAEQENPWKWHINLPRGKNYKMMCGVGAVPTTGVPSVSGLQYLQQIRVAGTGENKTIVVSLTESESDLLKVSIGDGSGTVSQLIPKSDVYTRSVFNFYSVGDGEVHVAAADEPFVVFYQTEQEANPVASSDDTANGVVVWMVPVD